MIYSFSTAYVGKRMIRPLESGYLHTEGAVHAARVVVLGGGLRLITRPEGRDYLLSENSKARLFSGFKLARSLQVPLVLSGGQVYQDVQVTEAELMARFLTEHFDDLPELILETTSKNTKNNLVQLQKRDLLKNSILISSAWHLPRVEALANSMNFSLETQAGDFLCGTCVLTWRDYLPSVYGLRLVHIGLRECLGLLEIRIRKV